MSQPVQHFPTGWPEVDRILGGGFVRGGFVLIGGDPGVGKSTLLLQLSGFLGKQNKKVLYVSGEESVDQSLMRAQRLGVKTELVSMASGSELESILNMVENSKPEILVIDSIQTIYSGQIQSAPGSVSQVRDCAASFLRLAKDKGVTVILVGHITKDGNLAGPKVLEHMVDTVLSFEGELLGEYRMLRASKNRFGPTQEIGIFTMDNLGLKVVENPSEIFLSERPREVMGSVVFAAMEGSRPLLCEIQALTHWSNMALPRRTAIGFEQGRVQLLVAILDRFLNLDLARKDVFLNVVAGLKLKDPAADLAAAAAIISSNQNIEVSGLSAYIGELGLTGEVRAVQRLESRVRELEARGMEKIFMPHSQIKLVKSKCQLIGVKTLADLREALGAPKKGVKASKPPQLPEREIFVGDE
jgi:DNA repair protein RadA/Sms